MSAQQNNVIAIETLRPYLNDLWEYLYVNQVDDDSFHFPKRTDYILALGNHDCQNIAEKAAALWHKNIADKIILSGGVTREFNFKAGMTIVTTEALYMADICHLLGVPRDKIIVENKSTNTGENYQFAQKELEARNLSGKSFTVVTIPYVTKRAYATGLKNWPAKALYLVGTGRQLADYLAFNARDRDRVINQMVGTFERMLSYPAKGFHIAMPVSKKAYQAYCALKKAGYIGDYTQTARPLSLPRELKAKTGITQKNIKPS